MYLLPLLFSVCRSYGDKVKVVFLECPYYSVSIWNHIKVHKQRDLFKHCDSELKNKIDYLNAQLPGLFSYLFFRTLNESNKISAPLFSVDLKKNH